MSFSRQARIDETRREVGWAYDGMRWLSEIEAREAGRERDALLAALSGWIESDFKGTKLHCGPLSPGCRICGEGAWGCHFVTRRCNTHCFYCPDSQGPKADCVPESAGWALKTPGEHVRFIAAFGIRGVGFTGGEPLLAPDHVVSHVRAIRQAFGRSVYLWLYTNGILADGATMARLGQAGLDEVRLDIAACGYELNPVAIAAQFIPTVTIEVPAIPEDFDVMTRLLPEIERIGVGHLNLHQLIAGPNNFKALQARGYHLLHQPLVPVMESELCALRLLLSARNRQASLPINYCCSAFKSRFQPRGDRLQAGRLARRPYEEVTAAGYLRSFLVSGPDRSIMASLVRFHDAGFPPDLWELQADRSEMLVHGQLLPYLDWESASVAIQYAEPRARPRNPADGFNEENLAVSSVVVHRQAGWDRAAVDRWRRRYESPSGGAGAVNGMDASSRWEELEAGLPEVY
jgi:uncharacterized protein